MAARSTTALSTATLVALVLAASVLTAVPVTAAATPVTAAATPVTAADAGRAGAGSTLSTGSTAEQAVRAAPAKRIVLKTAYGKKALRTEVRQKYTLSFSGRKGDRVRIAGVTEALYLPSGLRYTWGKRRTLIGPKGTKLVPGADGFTTLKRSGVHRFRFTANDWQTQLIKLVTRSTSTTKVTVPARTGYQYAVDVKVGKGRQIATRVVSPPCPRAAWSVTVLSSANGSTPVSSRRFRARRCSVTSTTRPGIQRRCVRWSARRCVSTSPRRLGPASTRNDWFR